MAEIIARNENELTIQVTYLSSLKRRQNLLPSGAQCANYPGGNGKIRSTTITYYLGIADGAKNNWSFLEQHTSCQLLDFFHVTEYLANVSYAAYPGKTDKPKRTIWLDERCKQLKHEAGAVEYIT